MTQATLPIKTDVRPVGFPPVAETLPGGIERIVSELKPEKIIPFGSYAYGNITPDSDVDLLVIMRTKAKEIDRYVAVSNVLYPRQFPVDILVKTLKKIKEASLKKGNFSCAKFSPKGRSSMRDPSTPLNWVVYAEEDLIMAKSALRRSKPLTTSSCFHSQ